MFLAAHYREGRDVRIDAVPDEFSNRLQGIALRACDNANRIPVIANAQLAAVLTLSFHAGAWEQWAKMPGLAASVPTSSSQIT